MRVKLVYANLSNDYSHFPFCSIRHLENINNWNVYCDQDLCRDANGCSGLFYLSQKNDVSAGHFDGAMINFHRGQTNNLFYLFLLCQ